LARWVKINNGPYIIPPEQTTDIQFMLDVPDDAPPGGHYAAILVSTESAKQEGEELAVKTSQAITSLVFLRVEGEVNENASIREFTVIDSLLEKPEAEFSLRFENKGNVHLQPRGDVVITNMWGTQRGSVPINYKTHFGNVLPNSIREFKFTWSSDFKITDVGRYKAIATLTYGEDGMKSVTSTAYFWVIPIKATLITIASIIVFITLIVLMIKAYVRRILALAGVDVDAERERKREEKESRKLERESKSKKAITHAAAPLKSGVVDLRQRLEGRDDAFDVIKTIFEFVVNYKKFFVSLALLIGIFIVTAVYISNATEESKDYTVTITEGGTTTTLEGENIK
jgi:hypothetical protein